MIRLLVWPKCKSKPKKALTGPGTVQVVAGEGAGAKGPINSIVPTDTTVKSALRVVVRKVGDGNVSIGSVSGTGALKSLAALQSDLQGNLSLGGLRSLSVGDVSDGAAIDLGNRSGATQIIAGRVGAARIHTASTLNSFTAATIAGAEINAAVVGTFKVCRAVSAFWAPSDRARKRLRKLLHTCTD